MSRVSHSWNTLSCWMERAQIDLDLQSLTLSQRNLWAMLSNPWGYQRRNKPRFWRNPRLDQRPVASSYVELSTTIPPTCKCTLLSSNLKHQKSYIQLPIIIVFWNRSLFMSLTIHLKVGHPSVDRCTTDLLRLLGGEVLVWNWHNSEKCQPGTLP